MPLPSPVAPFHTPDPATSTPVAVAAGAACMPSRCAIPLTVGPANLLRCSVSVGYFRICSAVYRPPGPRTFSKIAGNCWGRPRLISCPPRTLAWVARGLILSAAICAMRVMGVINAPAWAYIGGMPSGVGGACSAPPCGKGGMLPSIPGGISPCGCGGIPGGIIPWAWGNAPMPAPC